ncbi:hypothetical protein J6590_103715 [Homalodisca vitripennis]|nr:hypothetical protein J6590_103715 [Homalodisca vitripennis]
MKLLSLASVASDSEYREQRLLDVHNFCSHLLVSFWQCINQTLDEISKGEGWSGRACCGLPQSERCQQACITASGRKDLAHSCRQSYELAFFTCLDKQQVNNMKNPSSSIWYKVKESFSGEVDPLYYALKAIKDLKSNENAENV